MPKGIYKRKNGKVKPKRRGRPPKAAQTGQALAEVIPPKYGSTKNSHIFAKMFDHPNSPKPSSMAIMDDPVDLVNWIGGWFNLHPDGHVHLERGTINVEVM